jgi:drug/metabolite transporter (DMT)-like permease
MIGPAYGVSQVERAILMQMRPWLRRTLAATLYIVVVGAVLIYFGFPLARERHQVAGALAVASLICFGFGLVGIYTRRVSAPRARGRSPDTVPVLKDEHPVLFWMNVGLYLGVGIGLLYWALRFLD